MTAGWPAGRAEPLSIPRAWTEELAAAITPADDAPVPLPLTYFTGLLETIDRLGTSLDEVAADLSAGCRIVRRDRDNGEFYALNGARFTVFVHPDRAKHNDVPIAIANNVVRAKRIQRQEGLLSYDAAFHQMEFYQPAECDIGSVNERAMARFSADRRRHANAMRAAERGLARPPGTAGTSHPGLHAEARQRYAILQSLFTLLKQRSAVDGGARAAGLVAEPTPGQESCLRILLPPDAITGRFPDSGPVLVHVPGSERPLRLELRHVLPEDIETEPPRTDIAPGTAVTAEYQARFTLQRHQRALRAFLDEDVEGDWASLARLLIRPDDLPGLPGPPPPDAFFDTSLNPEQRVAVAGAVTTPHAFFIQGPPGTGKTTVICEIIRQLTARGERVLLLAPMHVAVDEVLKRVGDAPRVTALRLSWNDERVAPDLRRYTPENVAGEFSRKVRQVSGSKAGEWQDRIQQLHGEETLLRGFQTARRTAFAADQMAQEAGKRERMAAATADEAERTKTRTQDVVPTLENDHAAAFAAERSATVMAESKAAPVAAAAERQAALRQAAQETEAAAAAAARRAGTAVAAHQAAHDQANRALADELKAEQQLKDAQTAAQSAQRDAAGRVRTLRAAVSEAETALKVARRDLDRARAALDAQESRRTWLTSLTGALGYGALGEARRALDSAVGGVRAAEGRLQLSLREAEAAELVQVTTTQQGQEHVRGREEKLARAARAAWAARAGEPSRTAMQADATEATHAAQRARAESEAAEEAAVRAAAALGEAKRIQAQFLTQAEEAAGAARKLAGALQTARVAVTQARIASDAAATGHADAVERARSAHARADEQARAAADLGARAAAILAADPAALPDDAGIDARAREKIAAADRLRHYADLERRWFEVTAEAAARADGLRDLGDTLVHTANLVCCTTTGFGSKIVEGADFDTLIIDEASRVVDSEFLIGAVSARRWILVGDEHQLPPYVDQADEHHLHALAALHMTEPAAGPARRSLAEAVDELGKLWIEEEELHKFRSDSVLQTAERLLDSGQWSSTYEPAFGQAYRQMRGQHDQAEREMLRAMRAHMVRSLFERCVTAGPPRLRQRLAEQRRMIEPLATIVSEPVYHGDYRSAPAEELARCGVTPLIGPTWDRPLVFFDTSVHPAPGDKQVGTGFVNTLEAEWAESVCRQWERELREAHVEELTVSILTFYRAQARLIRDRLGYPRYPGFRVLKFEVIDAIDRIQGQESDLVVLSFCRARPGRRRSRPPETYGRWLQDVRRLNVACTRARRGLALIGHAPTLGALNGVAEAEKFYHHLFAMFDQPMPGTLFTQQVLVASPAPRPHRKTR